MITAQEARELTEQSEVHVNKYLALVEVEIRKQAALGKKSFSCYVTDLWDSTDSWSHLSMTPLQAHVMEKLKASPNYFGVQWTKDGDSYVPRAYEDDSNPRKIQNYCLTISW